MKKKALTVIAVLTLIATAAVFFVLNTTGESVGKQEPDDSLSLAAKQNTTPEKSEKTDAPGAAGIQASVPETKAEDPTGPADVQATVPETNDMYEDYDLPERAMNKEPDAVTKSVDIMIAELNDALETGKTPGYYGMVLVNAYEFPDVVYDENGAPASVYGIPIVLYQESAVQVSSVKRFEIQLAEGVDLRDSLIKIWNEPTVMTTVPIVDLIMDWWT